MLAYNLNYADIMYVWEIPARIYCAHSDTSDELIVGFASICTFHINIKTTSENSSYVKHFNAIVDQENAFENIVCTLSGNVTTVS